LSRLPHPDEHCSSCLRAFQLLYVYTRELPSFVIESVVLCAECNSKQKLDQAGWKKTLKIRTPMSVD